jgi:hypothetical protein
MQTRAEGSKAGATPAFFFSSAPAMREGVGEGRPAPLAAARSGNRRRHARYVCRLPVELFASAPGPVEMIMGVARNLSRGGMLLECSESLAPGATLHLSFAVPRWMTPRNRTDQPMTIEARTRHVNPATGTCGLQFAIPLE